METTQGEKDFDELYEPNKPMGGTNVGPPPEQASLEPEPLPQAEVTGRRIRSTLKMAEILPPKKISVGESTGKGDALGARFDLSTLLYEVNTTLAQNTYYMTEETGTAYTFSTLMRRRRQLGGDNKGFKEFVGSLPTIKGARFQNLPKFPKRGQKSAEDVASELSRTPVRVIPGPEMIRQPVNHEVPDFVPGFDEIREGEMYMTPTSNKVADLFPDIEYMKDGKMNKSTAKIPLYLPVYEYEHYDKEVVSDLTVLHHHFKDPKVKAKEPVVAEALGKLYEDTNNVILTNYFGNGTIAGQIGRHIACLNIRDLINTRLNTKGVTQKVLFKTFKEYTDLMNKRFPLNEVAATLDMAPTELIDKYETSDDPTKNPVFTSIQLKSGAGIQWVNKKREEVLPQDYSIADFLYQIFKTNSWDMDNEPARDAFWQRFKWFRLAKCKPKPEVYAIEKLYEKPMTRNIYEMNSCGQVVSQMILKPTHSRAPTWFDDPEIWSILGAQFYYGGCDYLVRTMMKRGHGSVIVYADNLYIVQKRLDGKEYFVSYDSSKAESSIGKQIIQFEMERSLSKFEGYNVFYKSYARHVHPNLSVDFVAVLGQHQFQVPYMGSGTQGTAYFNTAKMIQFTENWRSYGFTEATLIRAQSEVGVVLEEVSAVPLDQIREKKTYCFMDLLGFDVVNLKSLFNVDLFVPVLSYPRMLKTLIYFKNLKRNEEKLDDLTFAMLKLARLRSLYMLGGWLYPGLDLLIQKMCRKIITDYNLTSKITRLTPEQVLQELSAVNDMQAADPNTSLAVLAIVSKTDVPTVYDMVEFTGGTQKAEEFAVELAKSSDFKGMLHNLVPLHVYEMLREIDPTIPEPKYAIVSDPNVEGMGMSTPFMSVPFKEFLKKKASFIKATREQALELKEGVKRLWAEEEDEDYEETLETIPKKEAKFLPQLIKPEEITHKTVKLPTQSASVPLKGQYTEKKSTTKDKAEYVKGQIMQHLPTDKKILVSITMKEMRDGYDAKAVAAKYIADAVRVPIYNVFTALSALEKEKHHVEFEPLMVNPDKLTESQFLLNRFKSFVPFT